MTQNFKINKTSLICGLFLLLKYFCCIYFSKPLQVLLWDTEGTEDVLINEVLSESNQAQFLSNIHKIIEENAKLEAKGNSTI